MDWHHFADEPEVPTSISPECQNGQCTACPGFMDGPESMFCVHECHRVDPSEIADVGAVREYPEYMLPHSEFGDPECCGLLFAVDRGSEADITCNECGVVVRTVRIEDRRRILDEMELSLDVASEKCSACGAVNLFPGFSKMLAFTCRECGAANKP